MDQCAQPRRSRLAALRVEPDPAILDGHGFLLLRSKVVAWGCLGVVAMVALAVLLDGTDFDARHHLPLEAVVCAALTGLAAWCRLRGERLGDAEFTGVLAVALAISIVNTGTVQRAGSVIGAEWVTLGVVVVAAALARRRGQAVALIALSLVTMVVLSLRRLDTGTPDAFLGAVVESWVVVLVGASVRILRDVAVAALGAAAHGEITDPLTGLLNRRGLERRSARLSPSRLPGDDRFAVLVVDIDHFKKVNDTRGHSAGDAVLRSVADVLAASVRPEDVVARLGGEEFLLLVQVGRGRAPDVAESLRRRVQEALHPVTVSIGLVECPPDLSRLDPDSLWSLAAAADVALYAAKNGGRNRVEVSPAPAGVGHPADQASRGGVGSAVALGDRWGDGGVGVGPSNRSAVRK